MFASCSYFAGIFALIELACTKRRNAAEEVVDAAMESGYNYLRLILYAN